MAMLRTHVGKYVFLEKKKYFCDCSLSNQMHLSGKLTEIAPYARNYFCDNIVPFNL